jgi:lipopolysaccharide export system protein LptC
VLFVITLAQLIVWPIWHEMTRPHLIGKDQLGSIRMLNPRFVGQDNKGRGFSLSAREASRDAREARVIYLLDPVVVLKADQSNATRLKAQKGVYTEEGRLLRLIGDVRIDSGTGYRFSSNEAIVDTRLGSVVGQSALKADGPMGEIEAQAYGIYDKGDRTVFRGGVRATLSTQ